MSAKVIAEMKTHRGAPRAGLNGPYDEGDIEARFWARVEKTDTCWIWHGKKSGGFGYGGFMFHGKTYAAHRYSWTMHYGFVPADKNVLHKCDVPACVNPDHLYLGTQSSNMKDVWTRRRRSRMPHKPNGEFACPQK